ncbi:SAM-dependent methyltransferase [Aquiflexum sp.]|uniref:SAM-dependent methyltransferase n=1 Tax=Aquiflexum sp. TaxID=1872584 RepID=UPI003593688F
MTNNLLDEKYWTTRYLNYSTAWDAGEVTLPIKQYLDQLINKEIKILVPGAGNGHEVIYAFENGFKNTHILDISLLPLGLFEKACPEFPKEQIHHQDFFEHTGQYDLILEQTFFCSLPPTIREEYVKKMKELLKPSGKLVGVLFGVDFKKEGPPFGGELEEYRQLFSNEFEIVKLETCYNSIPPRMGTELFFSLRKNQ